MTGITDDPKDPRIERGPADETPRPQAEVYLVLPESERQKGFVRPYRDSYEHVGEGETEEGCGSVTTMGRALSETYARNPQFYGSTYCVVCQKHRPVAEFVWTADGARVGS